MNALQPDQPFVLSADEQLQLLSLLNPSERLPELSEEERIKKVNYCKHCFIQFDKKATYTDHIRSIHQRKAKIGLGKGSFTVTIQRTGDGHFYCTCGRFKTVHPKPLACHMKKCRDALSLDPGLSKEYDAPSFHYPPTVFSTQISNGDVNIVDWRESDGFGNMAESA